MKKYPRLNWKQLTDKQKEIFDRIEQHIIWNKEVLLKDTKNDNIETLAFNSAFTILTDRFIIN